MAFNATGVCLPKLPLTVDRLQVDFSGRIICQGGSDEQVEVQTFDLLKRRFKYDCIQF